MHTGHDESLAAGIVEDATTGAGGGGSVHVVGRAVLRALELQGGAVDQVADDEQPADAIGSVAGRVTDGIDGEDAAGQRVAEGKEMQAVAVGVHGLHLLCVPVGRHGHPGVILRARGVDLGVGEGCRVAVHQSADVVAVEVGEVDEVNLGRVVPEATQRVGQSAVGEAVAGVEEDDPAAGLDEEGADGGGHAVGQAEARHDAVRGVDEQAAGHGVVGGVVADPGDGDAVADGARLGVAVGGVSLSKPSLGDGHKQDEGECLPGDAEKVHCCR